MISCAPRIKKDNGPTWTSVSIHWTDSDMNRLEPVDGLPWIRTTDKAKLFNKNGPLRVVASYRTTDGVDPATEYRHVSMIADAIEQYVLVKITMPKDVSAKPGADWPKFRVWAFLQPPIIGRDKKRRDANGGYVVDDIPRAGWFEAVVDGKTMTAEEVDYSKGHKSPAGKKPLKVTGERDASDPRVVRFKICARVANNESEAELKEKSQKLRKKNQDVSLVEAGSYLKVWVRNEERTWPQKPLDDDSEKIVQSMADSDSIKPGGGADPRKFRNHTWKRSRLATHKSITKGKEPDKNLLYVGLYPAHVIAKIEKIETEMKAPPKQVESTSAREFEFGPWFAFFGLFIAVVFAMRKWRDGMVSGNTKNRKMVDATKFVLGFAEKFAIVDLCTAYAVGGFSEPSKVGEKFKEAERHPDATNITKTIMTRVLEAVLEGDMANRVSERQGRAEERQKSALKKFKPGDFHKFAMDWKEQSAKYTFQVIEGADKKFGPWPSFPRPLPAWLAWLGFQTKLVVSGNLPISVILDGSGILEDEQKAALRLSTKGAGFSFAFSLMIRALWSYAADAVVEGEKDKRGKTPVLDTLKDVLELIDIEVTMTPTLSSELLLELIAKWKKAAKTGQPTKEWMFEEWKFLNKLAVKLSAVIHAQASVFQWNYDGINGTILEGTQSYGAYLKDFVVFGTPYPKLMGTWGKTNYDRFCHLEPASKGQNRDKKLGVNLGDAFDLYLGYEGAADAEKCKVSLKYVGDPDNVKAVSKVSLQQGAFAELQSDLPVKKMSSVAGSAQREEVTTKIRMTWNEVIHSEDIGSIAFRSMMKEKRAELLQFFQTCLNEERIELSPLFKSASDEEFPLSQKSELFLNAPKASDDSAVLRKTATPDMAWLFNFSHYHDTHIWARLREHDWASSDDVIPLKGAGKSGWKLYELKGGAERDGKRLVCVPLSDIGVIADKEDSYQFYLELALFDDESCILHTSSNRIEVQKSMLPGRG